MAIASSLIPQVSNSSTFSGWVSQTNLLAAAMNSSVLTASDTTQFGGANSTATTGTVTHNGLFVANSVQTATLAGSNGALAISATQISLDSSSPIASNSSVTALTVSANTVGANTLNAVTLNATGNVAMATSVVITPSGMTIGTSTTPANLTIYGNIVSSNNVSGFDLSDARLKLGIKEIDAETALSAVRATPGVEFDWDKESGLSGHDLGVIAQSIEPFFSDIIRVDEKGYKRVNYRLLIPVLMSAVRAQQAQIDKLKAAVVRLGGSL